MITNKVLRVARYMPSIVTLLFKFGCGAMLTPIHHGGVAQFSSVSKQFVMKNTNIGFKKFLSRTLQGSKLGLTGLGLCTIGIGNAICNEVLGIKADITTQFTKEYTALAAGIAMVGYSYYSYDDTDQKNDHIEKTETKWSTSSYISYAVGSATCLLPLKYIGQGLYFTLDKQLDPKFQKYTSKAMDLFGPSLALASSGLFFKQIINLKDRRNQILPALSRYINENSKLLSEDKLKKIIQARESVQNASDNLNDSFKLAIVLGSIANGIFRNERSEFPSMLSIAGACWYPLQEIKKLNTEIKSAVRLIKEDDIMKDNHK